MEVCEQERERRKGGRRRSRISIDGKPSEKREREGKGSGVTVSVYSWLSRVGTMKNTFHLIINVADSSSRARDEMI